jgi:hypothetical protein
MPGVPGGRSLFRFLFFLQYSTATFFGGDGVVRALYALDMGSLDLFTVACARDLSEQNIRSEVATMSFCHIFFREVLLRTQEQEVRCKEVT